ncbi:MAG: AsmA family protein, partial [Burkholderiales bacterium]
MASAGGIIAGLLLALALLAAFDWNRAKPWINERVSEATGRSFAINGDLSMGWQAPAQPLSGWRRWIPWPHLRAKDVTLGNPDWATTGPTMAQVQQIDFSVNLLPLLQKVISVNSLILTEPQIALELSKNGENNWTFKKKEDESKSKWQLALNDISITRGTVRFVDPVKRADVTTRIDTLTEGGQDAVVWKLSGKFGGETVSGGGKAGALLSLQRRDVKYPVEANLKIGKSDISVKGTLTDPAHFSALDVSLKIAGASMAQLFPFTGLVLPETPRFSTEGRLVGKIARNDTHLRYEKFKGKV